MNSFKNIIVIVSFIFSAELFSKDIQINHVVTYITNLKFFGPIKSIVTITVSPGFRKFDYRTKLEKWSYFNFFENHFGTIMLKSSKNILYYDAEVRKYEIVDPNSNSKLLSLERTFPIRLSSMGFDDDTHKISITRSSEKRLNLINGFSCVKWITSFTSGKKELTIHEWYTDKIPIGITADSLSNDIISKFGFKDFKSENYLSSVISSDRLIEQIGGKDSTSQLRGMCVKAVAYIDDNFKTTFSYELKELYAESFNALSYTIPEGYKKK